jgi:triosephosphate isomerase (TIM)
MKTLIVNFKNYPQVLGEGSLKLAMAAEQVARAGGVEVIVSPPMPLLGLVAMEVKIPVFSQTVGSQEGDKTTGAVLPEAVKASGARGVILNHSESRRPLPELRRLVPRLTTLSLDVCLCSRTASESARLAGLGTRYLAVEPPELIGSGTAVSKARPGLIRETVSAVTKSGYAGKILCGAGIVSGEDVRKAVELGAEGVLVSSSVVKASDWNGKLRELAEPLRD